MNQKILLIGGAALVGYYLYNKYSTPVIAATATGTGTGVTPTPLPTAVPFANTRQNILNVIQGNQPAMLNGVASPDQWNFYGNMAIPGWTAPAPESMFPNAADPHGPVSFSVWWQAVQPFLPQGLSGRMPLVYAYPAAGWVI